MSIEDLCIYKMPSNMTQEDYNKQINNLAEQPKKVGHLEETKHFVVMVNGKGFQRTEDPSLLSFKKLLQNIKQKPKKIAKLLMGFLKHRFKIINNRIKGFEVNKEKVNLNLIHFIYQGTQRNFLKNGSTKEKINQVLSQNFIDEETKTLIRELSECKTAEQAKKVMGPEKYYANHEKALCTKTWKILHWPKSKNINKVVSEKLFINEENIKAAKLGHVQANQKRLEDVKKWFDHIKESIEKRLQTNLSLTIRDWNANKDTLQDSILIPTCKIVTTPKSPTPKQLAILKKDEENIKELRSQIIKIKNALTDIESHHLVEASYQLGKIYQFLADTIKNQELTLRRPYKGMAEKFYKNTYEIAIEFYEKFLNEKKSLIKAKTLNQKDATIRNDLLKSLCDCYKNCGNLPKAQKYDEMYKKPVTITDF